MRPYHNLYTLTHSPDKAGFSLIWMNVEFNVGLIVGSLPCLYRFIAQGFNSIISFTRSLSGEDHEPWSAQTSSKLGYQPQESNSPAHHGLQLKRASTKKRETMRTMAILKTTTIQTTNASASGQSQEQFLENAYDSA